MGDFFKINKQKVLIILGVFIVLFFIPIIPHYECAEPGPCGLFFTSLFGITRTAGLDDLFSFPIGMSLILIEIIISYLLAYLIYNKFKK